MRLARETILKITKAESCNMLVHFMIRMIYSCQDCSTELSYLLSFVCIESITVYTQQQIQLISQWGTWKAGVSLVNTGIRHPSSVMKNVIPVVMAGGE